MRSTGTAVLIFFHRNMPRFLAKTFRMDDIYGIPEPNTKSTGDALHPRLPGPLPAGVNNPAAGSGVLTLAAVAKYPHEYGYLARCPRR